MKQADTPLKQLSVNLREKLPEAYGGNSKVKALTDKFASVTDPKTGKHRKPKLPALSETAANVDYNRRGVITKGAEIETALGVAKVTSRPGIDGIINAVLIAGKEKA